MIKLINIVDDIRMVNYGIWSAAIISNGYLTETYGYECQLWYPEATAPNPLPDLGVTKGIALASTTQAELEKLVQAERLTPDTCIIITHGSWRYATHWGAAFKAKGFIWIYLPQGMLEPWSMSQKRLKKQLYFNLVEKRLIKNADIIRAVSSPERENLIKTFKQVWLNQNAIDPKNLISRSDDKNPDKHIVLFMARLHHKKGIVPLIQGWLKSEMARDNSWELRVAGPDDGELEKMNAILSQHPGCNITYLGSVYKEAKRDELANADFYILPSASEGFPTSVVEAMGAGLIPIISKGCNFPEAEQAGLAIMVEQSVDSIIRALNNAYELDNNVRRTQSDACQSFIRSGYTTQIIGALQHQKYQELLSR